VRVELATRLEDFLGAGQGAIGGGWEVEQPHVDDPPNQRPIFHPVPEYVLVQAPTTTGVTLDYLSDHHSATRLGYALRLFLRKENPGIPSRNIEFPPNFKLNIWSRVRLFHSPLPFKPSEGPHIDVVRAQPIRVDRFERVSRPARFDTVLILTDKTKHGIHRKSLFTICAGF
jgi:hypothetical protein